MTEQNSTESAAGKADEVSPLREMLIVALPSVVTMTSYTIMQSADKLMVKEIGPDPVYVAAQGNGGITVWVLIAFGLGLTSLVNSFVSQNLGAGKPERGAAYCWTGLWLGLAWWMAVLVPAAIFTPQIFGMMGHDDQLLDLEIGYGRIVIAGSVLILGGRCLHQFFYGLHRPTVVMVSAITGNLVNLLVNWLLIFGAMGFPKLGIVGAAIGTVVGTGIELLIPLVLFLSPRYHRLYQTRSAWKFCSRHARELFRVGWPAGMMWANDLLCWGYLMTFMLGKGGAAAGEDPLLHNTAGWIGLQYMHISFMPAVGISIATQAVVGKAMGMGDPDRAAQRAYLGLKIAMIYMGACALVMIVMRGKLMYLFIDADTPPDQVAELVRIGGQVMIAAAVFQIFDAVAITMSAALRGAGDTIWPSVATVVLSWGCIVGLGNFLIRTQPQLGSIGPWIGAATFVILLGIALLARFRMGKWRTIRLTHDGPLRDLPPDEVAPGTSPGAS